MRLFLVGERVLFAGLLVALIGYLSVLSSGRAVEDRVAKTIAGALRKPGGDSPTYVWPSVAPDSASILERNGVITRLCAEPGSSVCYPAACLYRSVTKGPFVASVRWQYSRDHHGVGGTRRFFCFFGLVRELRPERTVIQ
jgi:hypothetical protein